MYSAKIGETRVVSMQHDRRLGMHATLIPKSWVTLLLYCCIYTVHVSPIFLHCHSYILQHLITIEPLVQKRVNVTISMSVALAIEEGVFSGRLSLLEWSAHSSR